MNIEMKKTALLASIILVAGCGDNADISAVK